MGKNLLIKLNGLIVDTNSGCCKAAKKSVEFFLGRMMADDELPDFKTCSTMDGQKSKIEKFLNENGMYIREAAINKKFNEYLFGKEFSGLISEAELLISSKNLSMMEKERIILLSVMPEDATEFVKERLGINADVISCDDVMSGLANARKRISQFSYVGDNMQDYEAAVENKVHFIGVGIKEEIKGDKINKIDELF